MNRLICVLALALAFTAPAWALDKEAFSKDRFDQLQAEGALILVDVYATWCPTCAAQQKVLEAYVTANPDVALHILEVDFDDDKEWVRHFRAPRQSTLLLYRGEEQLWFSVAETRKDVIFAEIDKAAGN